jgi:DNA-binding transcriptional LysR family regulator
MIHSEHLETFLELTERLSFTRVAEVRRLTQPAIHLHVKKLEEALGVTLYRRAGRRLEITPEGWRLAAHAREVRRQTERVLAELAGEVERHEVVLAAGEGSTRFLLAPAIRSVAGRVHVQLLTADGPAAASAVLDGRAALAVAALAEVPRGLQAKALDRVPLVVLAPPGHALGQRAVVPLEALDGVPLIVPPSGRPHRVRLAETLAARGGALRVALEVGGWDAMVDFVDLGLGVAVVNGFVPVPARLVARRLVGLSGPEYRLLSRGASPHAGEGVVGALAAEIVAGRAAWRAKSGTAWARAGQAEARRAR